MDYYVECEKCFAVTAYYALLPTGATVCIKCKEEYEESKVDMAEYSMTDR